MANRRGWLAALTVGLGVALVLSGCAFGGVTQTTSKPLISPPPTVPLTESELADIRADEADLAWLQVLDDFPNAQRPSATFVAFLTPRHTPQPMVDCLADNGVEAVLTADGQAWRVPDLQLTEGTAVAQYVCAVRFPILPRPPLSELQIAFLYDYLTGVLGPCLEAEHYEVPEPPTKAEFVKAWPENEWYPSHYYAIEDAERYREVEESCPPVPAGLFEAGR